MPILETVRHAIVDVCAVYMSSWFPNLASPARMAIATRIAPNFLASILSLRPYFFQADFRIVSWIMEPWRGVEQEYYSDNIDWMPNENRQMSTSHCNPQITVSASFAHRIKTVIRLYWQYSWSYLWIYALLHPSTHQLVHSSMSMNIPIHGNVHGYIYPWLFFHGVCGCIRVCLNGCIHAYWHDCT